MSDNKDITTTTGTELTTPTSLPKCFARDLVDDIERFRGNPHHCALNSRSRKETQKAIAESWEYLNSEPYLAPVRRLELAERPAGQGDIAKLFGLVMTFPNATKADLTYFQGRLAEFIDSRRPSELTVGVIELAIRKLEDTCKFLPTIAEIREAMDQAGEILATLRLRASYSVSCHNAAVEQLTKPRYHPPGLSIEAHDALYAWTD